MDDKSYTCQDCGGHRVAPGLIQSEGEPSFVFSEIEQPPFWKYVSSYPGVVGIRQDGKASLCIDCGKVIAVFTVDIEAAKKVVLESGVERLKSYLDSGQRAV